MKMSKIQIMSKSTNNDIDKAFGEMKDECCNHRI